MNNANIGKSIIVEYYCIVFIEFMCGYTRILTSEFFAAPGGSWQQVPRDLKLLSMESRVRSSLQRILVRVRFREAQWGDNPIVGKHNGRRQHSHPT